MKLIMLLLTAAILVIVGCNSSSNNTDQTTQLTILTEERAPLNFIQDGKLTGQAAEVVEELVKRSATKVTIKVVPWEVGYKAVLEEPDTALFATIMTTERKELFQWVGPITVMDVNLYARKGSGIILSSLDDAKKVSAIATITDYSTEQMLEQEGFVNLHSHPNEESAARALLDGEVNLYISTGTTIANVLQNIGANMDDVESLFTVSSDLAYIAFSKETSPRLVSYWQDKLNGMKSDGSFNTIYTKWFPSETPPGIYQMITEEYPPITFMQDGKPSGFVTDMVREIASRLQIPDNIRLTSWNNAYNMALLHPNIILFSAERTTEREPLFHWVGPVGKNSATFYAKKGSGIKINSLDDAKNVNAIATTTGWFTEEYLENEGFTNLISSKDPAENVRQLMNAEVQLSIFTSHNVSEIVKNAGFSMDDFEPVYTVSQTYFYIAISKDTPPEVAEKWQYILDVLKKDGTFEEIYRSYLPDVDLEGLL